MNLPQKHHYLVRLRIEQQRLPSFALKSGVLNEDGVIYSSLQVNRSLLLAMLAKIKALFETYAVVNSKHEENVLKCCIDLDHHLELDSDLMSLL